MKELKKYITFLDFSQKKEVETFYKSEKCRHGADRRNTTWNRGHMLNISFTSNKNKYEKNI